MSLSLRTRLLAGLAVVAAVLVVVAWSITTSTRDHLIDQIDDQLNAAFDPTRDGRFPFDPPPISPDVLPELPERTSAMFEGFVGSDGELVIFFESNLPGREYSPPDVERMTSIDTTRNPFSLPSVDREVDYRVYAFEAGDGLFIRALPLAEVDETMARLIVVEVIGIAAVWLLLAAVAWWVVRLGIRPISAMAKAASKITDDDLSVRFPEPVADGTEATMLAGALNTMLDRLEVAVDDRRRSEARLRRFISDASHELRTPITTVLGFAQLYRDGGLQDSGALDDAMRRTEQEARRTARLVDDMLTLARLDQHRPLEPRHIDIGALLNDAIANAHVTAPDHSLIANIESDLIVSADEDQLWQVVANIISNATTHTPAGSTVAATIRSDGTDCVVEISDDGPGVELEHLAHLTERFYRADPSRTRQHGGSGLGLSIASTATQAHGGSLDITSERGIGTTVTIRLPLAD